MADIDWKKVADRLQQTADDAEDASRYQNQEWIRHKWSTVAAVAHALAEAIKAGLS